MPSVKVLSNDKYKVYCDSVITDYDRKILTRLYQPICGHGAIMFYFTLWSELEGDQTLTTSTTSIERLCLSMQCNNYEIQKYASLLEGIGLIKTHYKLDSLQSTFVFILYAPLSPYQFFDHDLYNIMLIHSLHHQEEYERTRSYFLKNWKVSKNYTEISNQFNEIYKLDLNDSSSLKISSSNNALSKNEGEAELSFDFEEFYEEISKLQISRKLINQTLEEQITILANSYDILPKKMALIILGAMENNKIDVNQLRILSRGQGKSIKPTKIQTKDKIELLNKTNYIDYLKLRNNGNEPLDIDRKLLMDLKIKTNLSDGVMNVLVDYTLSKTNNRLTPGFISKIAGSLVRSNIQDAKAAIDYLNQANKSASTKKLNTSQPKLIQDQNEAKVEITSKKSLSDEEKLGEEEIDYLLSKIKINKQVE